MAVPNTLDAIMQKEGKQKQTRNRKVLVTSIEAYRVLIGQRLVAYRGFAAAAVNAVVCEVT